MKTALIAGICGKMGGEVAAALQDDEDLKCLCGVDLSPKAAGVPVFESFEKVDLVPGVIIDFSSPKVLKEELEWAKNKHVPVVLAATGYTGGDFELIKKTSAEIAILQSANFSLGICLLKKLAKEAALALGGQFDIEIIEKHHRFKADAPSGTAIALAESINSVLDKKRPCLYGRGKDTAKRGDEIGVHSVRGGTIVGEHEVIFAGGDEVLTISHSAGSRKIFALGAVKAAKWLFDKPAGLYSMDDVL